MDSDIAIIGMACRVAGANSPAQLWENLMSAKDVQRRVTRFNIDGFYNPQGGPLKGLTNVHHAYMLDDDAVDKFDNAFFHTNPTEASAMDPQHRMLLEVSYEAIENAGIPLEVFCGTDTAVFTGTSSPGIEGSDYHTVVARDPDVTPKYIVTGTAGCMAANRLSYFYDLSGPSISVDTACSSSMAALHQAVRTLQHGDSNMALVCGANLFFNPESFISMTELGFLSPSGRCRSFDAAGDGYGRGEGIATLLLKPLRAALADCEPIRAVIKGTRLNQDGRTQGITLPSTKAQTQNMSRLYEELAVESSTIQYLEAHGTGTAAGDPLELRAVNELYNAKPLVIGSVKSNVGHCEAASALTAIIKTVLSLENGQIPAQMHFATPNPAVDFTNLMVTQKTLDWPDTRGDVRRAAINTFGAGGTNGHAVLEAHTHPAQRSCTTNRPWLFKISAADRTSLQAVNKTYAEWLKSRKPSLKDLAHTMTARRSTLRYSRFIIASDHDTLRNQLLSSSSNAVAKSGDEVRKLLFVFTGQGAQWVQMGCSLIRNSPLFRSVIKECEEALGELPDGPSWSMIGELSKDEEHSHINDAQYSQPLCTALQIGLVSLLRSWGVRPAVAVGHSSGEIAAAFAAGMISLRHAIITAYYRGYVLSSASMLTLNQSQGAMCAVGLGETECKALLRDHDKVQLAATNSPSSCTVSGDQLAIQAIIEVCSSQGHFCRLLKVDRAYHSDHMLPLASPYQLLLGQAGVTHSDEPNCSMFSSVTGQTLIPKHLTPSYWARNMTSTVRFAGATSECLENNPTVDSIIEIGPHPALKGPIQEILRQRRKDSLHYFTTCRRGADDYESMLNTAGEMIAAGSPLDLRAVNATDVCIGSTWKHEYGNVLTDLPSYQWNHTASFWSESRVSKNMRFRAFPRHELLGSRYAGDIPSRACWRNHLNPSVIDWLAECNGRDIPGLSPAICLLMAVEAARQTWMLRLQGDSTICMTDLEFHDDMLHSAAKDILESADIHFVSRIDETLPRMSFEIFRTKFDGADEWVLCASGLLKLSSCMPPESYDEVHIVQQNHMLLQQAQSLYPDSLDMDNLQMGSCVMSGEAAYRSPTIFSYPIHPLALATVLSLGPIPLVCTNLPAKYRISSIPTLKMSITDKGAFTPEFVIDANYDRAGGAVGKVQVRQGINTALDGTIAYSATELIAPKPAMSSLFFKPVRLPDITRRLDFEEFDIKELLTLVTHKWPMADIILDNIPAPAQEKILSVLDAQGGNPKQRYRSIQILGDFDLTDLRGSSRIVKELSPHVSAHIVFALSDRTVIPLVEKLRPSGLVCIRGSPEENRERFTEQLDFLFRINGVDEQPWALWRLRNNDPSNLPKHERVVFCSQNLHIKHSWLVDLEPSAVETFMNEQCTERFNAIVVDDLGKSVIASWAGRYLVPWLQYLIKHSKSLLWVTLDAALNPFVGLAGSLLRTLQAEQPSLKVSWLCLSQTQFNQHSLEAEIEDAFQAMLRGDNEVQSEVDPTGTRIIRYLPDENLSAATGASLPRLVSDPLGEKDYALAMAGPREPVILSYDPSSSTAASTGLDCDSSAEQLSGTRHSNDDVNHSLVKVSVKASMNAGYDLAAYAGDMACDEAIQTPGQEDRHALGTFFAGTVLLSPDASFPEGSHVAGWSHGAHVNVLDVPAQNVYSSRDNNHGRTVSDFATYANMVAALDGHIRVRDDDVVRLEDPSDRLHQSFDRTCTSLRFPNLATISSSDGTEKAPTFTLKIGNNHALLADDKPIDVARYLCSNPPAMRKVWDERQSLEPLIEVPFKHFKDLFKSAAEDPEPRVLIHGDLEGVSHVPIYRKPSNIVSSKGAHIIIGGLGGLGRYLCSWLVEQGARTIYAISRSGISSPEAQQMSDNLNSTPCIKFEAIKADACDRTSMSAILSTIRSQHPIVGVTNMAMVLSDAPMASMMAEEWDRALRAKIDSSWILHELTKGDELEYFVLFSSIASVLGNRNQGSYNVGNTFLNALATYRRRIGKTAVAIALGAMTDIGVLTTLPLSTPSTTTTTTTANILTRSGLTHLTTTHLDKILQAAIHNSNSNPTTTTTPDEAIILTGLETFQRTHNGALAGKKGGVYWMDLPEFSHLAVYTSPFASADDVGGSIGGGLKERIISCIRTRGDGREGRGGKEMGTVVEEGVLSFLEGLLGVREGDLDRGVGMGVYGMDSLAAVGVQLWCFRDLGIDVTVPEILAARNLEAFITTVKVRVGERYRGEKEG